MIILVLFTLLYIMMFDQKESIRFATWNFFTDSHGNADPRLPAWDWQYVIRNPQLGLTYGYRARMIYKPFISVVDVIHEYERWRDSLTP